MYCRFLTTRPHRRISRLAALALAAIAVSLPVSAQTIVTADKDDGLPAGARLKPGDTITYTTTITNTGPNATAGLQFTDTIDQNTTLVAGTLKVTPVALDDVYPNVIGNTLRSAPPTAC